MIAILVIVAIVIGIVVLASNADRDIPNYMRAAAASDVDDELRSENTVNIGINDLGPCD